MTSFDIVIAGGDVVIGAADPIPATIGIRGESIAAIVAPDVDLTGTETIDATGKLVLPGAIDPHVHIGYEGYAGMPLEALPSHFDTESRSALIGGVTTMLVTYRNAEPFEGIFEQMVAAGEAHSRVDFSYSLGITNDQQVAGIPLYYERFGVSSFKFYMVYTGEEAKATGNIYNRYDDGLFFSSIRQIAQLPGAMAMVHPENPAVIAALRVELVDAGRDGLAAWTESRPGFLEAESIRRALYLCEQVGCRLYIPHLSCRESLTAVAEHRARGTTTVHVETCPHYLTHTADDPVGALAKVNPPVRHAEDADALWTAISAGAVDTCGTDHCGVSRADKGPDIWRAVPGFSGMATMLPVLMTGVARGRLTVSDVARITASNTARIFNLWPRKGVIAVGSDADLVVVDPSLTQTVTPDLVQSRSDFSIYEGQELTGWPVATLSRGRVAMRDGQVLADAGAGRYLARHPQPAPKPNPFN